MTGAGLIGSGKNLEWMYSRGEFAINLIEVEESGEK
jgi:hypothetical protein